MIKDRPDFEFQTCVQPVNELRNRRVTDARFMAQLRAYHRSLGTWQDMSPPAIDGRKVDLHSLHCDVQRRGGAAQVDKKGEWGAIGSALRVGQGAGTRLREIYTAYLQEFVAAVEQGFKVEAADEDMEQFVQVKKTVCPKPRALNP